MMKMGIREGQRKKKDETMKTTRQDKREDSEVAKGSRLSLCNFCKVKACLLAAGEGSCSLVVR